MLLGGFGAQCVMAKAHIFMNTMHIPAGFPTAVGLMIGGMKKRSAGSVMAVG